MVNNFNSKKGWQNNIDKLLFMFASLYLITTLGWFWKYKQQSNIQDIDNQTITKIQLKKIYH